MMIGEFDYNDIFHGTDYVAYWLTYILMTVFIVVMSIIIMNLLVGLAVDDIKGVLDKAALKRMAMQVRHYENTPLHIAIIHGCKNGNFQIKNYYIFLIIPPAKRSFRGVYCFQPDRDSFIP